LTDQLDLYEILRAKEILDNPDEEYTLFQYQVDAVGTLGPDRNPLLLALGVGGEAGEVMEIIKKGNRPGREIDIPHLKEELGDVLWYLAVLADFYDLDIEEIALDNIDKLNKRYPRV
jgi:NTP pyrophosphatase (non-canonical NTP hydrolase)